MHPSVSNACESRRYFVSVLMKVRCHCLAITHVHDITAKLEDRVKGRFPQIYRLTIHPEPVEES